MKSAEIDESKARQKGRRSPNVVQSVEEESALFHERRNAAESIRRTPQTEGTKEARPYMNLTLLSVAPAGGATHATVREVTGVQGTP